MKRIEKVPYRNEALDFSQGSPFQGNNKMNSTPNKTQENTMPLHNLHKVATHLTAAIQQAFTLDN